MANPFLNIRQQASDTGRSLQWYQTQVRSLAALNPNKLMSNTPALVNNVLPGNMYMFFYEAKLKDQLPYYDMFPLVLPFRKVANGFYGLNLHYIPYGARFKILGALHEFATDEKINEATRIKISWNIVKSFSVLKPLQACVKHYLTDQVQSRFLRINYPDWITASLLPLERFNVNKTTVWKDSRERY